MRISRTSINDYEPELWLGTKVDNAVNDQHCLAM